MKRVMFFTLGIVLLVIGREAIAASNPNLNRLLRGKYAFTQSATCVQNEAGFGPNFQVLAPIPPQTPAVTFTFATRAILNYNGEGMGSLTEGESLSITHDATGSGAFPVNRSTTECGLTYVVNPDRSFTQELTCNTVFFEGGLEDVTQTQTPFQMQGQIGRGRRTLLISDTIPDVETVFRTPPSGPPFMRKRVCFRSGTAIKLLEVGESDN